MITTFLVYSFYLFAVAPVTSNDLFSACTSNSHCNVKNSYCNILSPTCGQGTCTCIPGYVQIDGACRRGVTLGGECEQSSDQCFEKNARCVNQRCTCDQGYKPGLRNNDCISNLKNQRFNGTCFDTVSCYYDMVCWDNLCQCYPGFKPIGQYDCEERQVGDYCRDNDACSQAPNSACFNNVCSCVSGYKRVFYVTEKGDSKQICINAQDTPRTEGQPCNMTAKPNPTICTPPFRCLGCQRDTTICARVIDHYSAADQQLSSALLVASFLALLQLL